MTHKILLTPSNEHMGSGRLFRLVLGCACLISAIAVHLGPAEASEVRAGVAQATFTVPRWVPLAGYSRRGGKPSRGVHDAVGVRALVWQDGETTAVLVSCDLLIIDELLFEAVRARLIKAGLPDDVMLLLAATHTHSGPGAYGHKFFEKISMGHFDPAVFDGLVDTIAKTIIEAWAKPQATRVAIQTGTTEGLVVNRVDASGVVDPEVIVTAVYPLQRDTPIALIVNFSAHPTTLGAWNMQLSGDYPGVLRRQLEQRFPQAVVLFLVGAVADQAPVKSGSEFEPAERIGQALAEQAAALMAQARPHPPSDVAAVQERLPLPPALVRIGRRTLPRWMGRRLVDDDATLSVLRVGEIVFIGVPCDLSASFGLMLKQVVRAKGLQPVIVGFASDYVGYCVPATLYEAKKYESSMAFNGPRAGELIVERLIQLLDQLGQR